MFVTSLRVCAATLLICSAAYPVAIFGIARGISPETADGSLLRDSSGKIIGSRLIAQGFTQPRYFWPRPSAVDYNAAGAGGSNLSPANPKITERASAIIAAQQADASHPLPADLVTASGGGLDPHISLAAAEFQIPRVAAARQIPVERVRDIVASQSFPAGEFLAPGKIVNVLELNLALDALGQP